MRSCRAASGAAASASGRAIADAIAGMDFALACGMSLRDEVAGRALQERPLRPCLFLVNKVFKSFQGPCSGLAKGVAGHFGRRRRLRQRPPATLLPAPGHLENRARIIVVKTQIEVVKIGDGR